MFRETVTPASPADAAYLSGLHDWLADPPPLTLLLARGQSLAAEGLTASALAFLACAQKRAPTTARVFLEKAAVERQAGMYWAAAADERVAARLDDRRMPDGPPLPELDADDFWVVSLFNDRLGYEALLAAATANPLRDDPLRDPVLARRIFTELRNPQYGSGRVEDFSFFVAGEDGPVMEVECDVQGGEHMGCRASAVVLTPLVPNPPPEAVALAVRQLRLSAEWAGCTMVHLEMAAQCPPPPALRDWMEAGEKAGWAELQTAWIDLTPGPDEILAGYRDAHRQSVRWGMKHIEVASSRDDIAGCARIYRDLHAQGGRQPGLDLDRFEALLAEGWLGFYVGRLEGEPVSALLTACHGRTTYYMASVNTRVGSRPVSHVLLHRAILDARAEGQRRFHLGTLHVDKGFDQKLRNIALFKRGFANMIENRILYLIPV
ncbi:conserved hypothetical protein [Candidatus Terasakiella magnetica]|nr:conserved hypothetical protein [Candidatus Terasakiella magnetica]